MSEGHVAASDPLELVLERVRARVRRRLAWLANLGELHGSHGLAATRARLAGDDDPVAEERWQQEHEVGRALCAEVRAADAAFAESDTHRLDTLTAVCGLEPVEVDLFHACLAQRLDPTLGDVYGELQGSGVRSCATEPLVARLFGHGRHSLLDPDSGLLAWHLVSLSEGPPGDPAFLQCDPQIRAWLEGRAVLDGALVAAAHGVSPGHEIDGWPVDEIARRVARAAERGVAMRTLIAGAAE